MKIQIESWLLDERIQDIRSSEYWNDQKNEQEKIFNIDKYDIEDLENNQHLKNIVALSKIIIESVSLTPQSNVLSLASGTCWLESILFNNVEINELINVDFSRHRIHDLSPKTIKNII